MEKWQYEMLQDQFSRKAENNPYGKNGNFKYEEGYKQGLLEDINRVEIVSHLLDGTLLSWLNNWKMRMGMLLAFLIENERCKNERL